MVFTVCSNEHTVKVILNSRNPTDDSTPYNLKFNLKESISCPTNMVSMVCLESATVLAPSMFGPQLLADATNKFQRLIYVGDVQQGVAQDYWNAKNDAANQQGSSDNTNYDTQTNSKSVKSIFTNCLNQDMTDTDNIARFLLEFLMATRCFKITINCLSGDSYQNTSVYWTPYVPAVGANVGWINGTPSTLTPATPAVAFTSAAPVTYTILSAKHW